MMDLFDNNRKDGSIGSMCALLLEDLLIQEKNEAHQCQCPESDTVNNFFRKLFAFLLHAH